ncbi:hypothetical protein PFICI_11685 [Pestalotiopsis fici W106-1]|uniref:Ig-like domain-containing protein n=1 Tax=Pestalotiopsis fici (strain W106-1 / CGMCC3.15140) TaxID=1229662 RepID=W3WR31_PESFW|nr:uncharacterized protein PFICI_11685 [Pestalotiopsis fici W106-1]ETS76298.1 hypothetical protein PFICI_11685 [Pestalotiopsis fici W106-1]
MLSKSYGVYATLSFVAQVANAQYSVIPPPSSVAASTAEITPGSSSVVPSYAAKGGFDVSSNEASTLQTSVISSPSLGADDAAITYNATPMTSSDAIKSSSAPSTLSSLKSVESSLQSTLETSSLSSALETAASESSSSSLTTSAGGILSSISSYIMGTPPSSTFMTTAPTALSASSGLTTSLSTTNESVVTSSSASSSGSVPTDSSTFASITASNSSVPSAASVEAASGRTNASVTELTTSTIYSTNIYTITSCAPTVKDCPGKLGAVTTEVISIGTTICPVTEAEAKSEASTVALSTAASTFVTSVPTAQASSTMSSSVSSNATSGVYSASSAISSTLSSAISELSSIISSYNTSIPTTVNSNGTQTISTASESSQVIPTTYSVSREITTSILSTVYSTNIYTITSCAPEVKDCPARKGSVTTELISLYTTICPITKTVLDGVTYTPRISAINAAQELPSSTLFTTGSASIAVTSPDITPLVTSSTNSSVIFTPVTNSSVAVSSIITSATIPSGTYPLTLTNSRSTIASANSSVASTAPTTPAKLTTSTVYSTNIYTITSCAPEVKDCPTKKGQVTTEVIAVSTTICPVTEIETGATTAASIASVPLSSAQTFSTSEKVVPSVPSTGSSPLSVPTTAVINNAVETLPSSVELTTSTVYTSSVYTVSSCAEGSKECSSQLGSLTTEMVALYTTICPVTAAVQNAAETIPVPSPSSVPSTGSSDAVPTIESLATEQSAPVGSSGVLPETATAVITSSENLSSTVAAVTISTTPALPLSRTSTVYSTTIYTVTSCAPEVTNCPASSGSPAVVTSIIALSTTVCPITYSTQAVTLNNTIGSSTVLVTTTITYEDAPTPTPSTPLAAAATAAESTVPEPASTKPGTTLTLGNYFTTVIEYEALTSAENPSPPPPPATPESAAAVPMTDMSSPSVPYAAATGTQPMVTQTRLLSLVAQASSSSSQCTIRRRNRRQDHHPTDQHGNQLPDGNLDQAVRRAVLRPAHHQLHYGDRAARDRNRGAAVSVSVRDWKQYIWHGKQHGFHWRDRELHHGRGSAAH